MLLIAHPNTNKKVVRATREADRMTPGPAGYVCAQYASVAYEARVILFLYIRVCTRYVSGGTYLFHRFLRYFSEESSLGRWGGGLCMGDHVFAECAGVDWISVLLASLLCDRRLLNVII